MCIRDRCTGNNKWFDVLVVERDLNLQKMRQVQDYVDNAAVLVGINPVVFIKFLKVPQSVYKI